jgi:hypothetical protein
MILFAPDILEAARGLSVVLCGIGIAIGLFLWLTGWYLHRFWIVLFATVAAGVYGLMEGPGQRVQPLVAGVVLALTAGMLSLLLVRLVAYFAGGVAALFVAHTFIPRFDEPIVSILAGGLLGLFLFRFWIMVLTSFGGALFLMYSTLCLLDRLGKLDMLAWADRKQSPLGWGCLGLTLVGLLLQVVLERRRGGAKGEPEAKKPAAPASPAKKKNWTDWGKDQLKKVAA